MRPVAINTTDEPLSAHRLFHTREIEHARHVVSQKFCAHKLTPGATHRHFDTCHNHAAGLSLSLNYLHYGCDISIDPGELGEFYLIQIPISGTALVKNGAREVEATAASPTVLNPTHATRMTWHRGCRKLLLQIDRDALHRSAEAFAGQPLNHAVIFDPQINAALPAVKNWIAKLGASVSIAQNGDAFAQNIHPHQALLEEELISGFLQAHRSSISHMIDGEGTAPSTGTMRRACSYIMENLTEPMTVHQISQAAGCSLRSLQVGFQRQFGCSPVEFLRRKRLNHAHFLLQTLPPDTLIGSIAYDAGFMHLGRFSIAYRHAFGRSPNETQKSAIC